MSPVNSSVEEGSRKVDGGEEPSTSDAFSDFYSGTYSLYPSLPEMSLPPSILPFPHGAASDNCRYYPSQDPERFGRALH